MAAILLEGSPKTPTVSFDDNTGLLELKGRSIPENSIEFYKPLIDWIDRYARDPKPKTTLHVQLEYFNTSSSKCSGKRREFRCVAPSFFHTKYESIKYPLCNHITHPAQTASQACRLATSTITSTLA